MDTRRIFAVGLVFLGIQAAWTVYNTYVPQLMQSRFGVDGAFVFYFLLADRLITMVLDPLLGRASDRLKQRIGTALPLVMLGIPFTSLLFAIIPLPVRLLAPAQTSATWQAFTNPFFLFAIASLFTMAFIRVPAVRMMPDIAAPQFRDRANSILQCMASVGGLLATHVSAALVMVDIGAPFWAALAVMVVSGVVLRGVGLPLTQVMEMEEEPDTPNDALTEGEELAPDALPDAGVNSGFGVAAADNSFDKLIAFLIGRVGAPVEGGEEQAGTRPEESTLVSRLTLPSLLPLLAAIVLAFMGLNLFNALFPTYAQQTLGLAEGAAGFLTTGFAIVAAVMTLFAWTVSERLGRRPTLLGGLGLMAAGLALTRLGGGPLVVGVWLTVAAAGWGLTLAHALPLILTLAPRPSTGLYTGFYFLAFVGAGVVGQYVTPALAGLDVGSRFLIIPVYSLLALGCVLAVRHNLEPEHASPAITAANT